MNNAAATSPTPPPADAQLPASRPLWLRSILRLAVLLLILLVLGAFFSIRAENFLTQGTMATIARQSVIVAVAATGMTAVIALGGIDLSIGSVVALSMVVTAVLLPSGPEDAGMPLLLAASIGIAAGTACGLLNGVLITGLRVMPFIVTLGTMLIFRGVAKWVADETAVYPWTGAMGWLRDLFARYRDSYVRDLLPPSVAVLLVCVVVMIFLLQFTRIGRHVFVIGSSEETARLCGVAVNRVKILVYTAMGALSGLAGVLLLGQLDMGSPTEQVGMELEVIAAVVIGGGSLAGGEGSVLGTLLGVLIMVVINNGCGHLDVPTFVQEIVTGGIIIGAVAVDSVRHRRMTGAH